MVVISSSLPLIWGPRFIVLLSILWNVLCMLTIPAKSLKADARGFRLVFDLQDRPALEATINLQANSDLEARCTRTVTSSGRSSFLSSLLLIVGSCQGCLFCDLAQPT